MSTLRGRIELHASTWSVLDDATTGTYTMPVGSATLAAIITSNPPRPDQLTNAIGTFVDHLDDVTRELPTAGVATRVELHGPGLHTFVSVEVGDTTALPHTLTRLAAEEVFRTLATETDDERTRNPGLPAHESRSILGVSCAIVAVLRALDRTDVTVVHA